MNIDGKAKGHKLIIKHAAELVTCAGSFPKKGSEMNDIGIIQDGALVIEDGIIRKVGPTEKVLEGINESDYQVIDATGKCVLPGFVDSHTHFIFGGYRPEEFFWRLNGTPYLDILAKGGGILNTVAATKECGKDQLKTLGKKRLDDMLAMGVTTVEGKSGYGLDLTMELEQLSVMAELNQEHSVEVVSTYLGAHAIPPHYKGKTDEYVDFMVDKVLPAVAQQHIAEFCDVFCEQGVFSVEQSRKILLAAQKLGLKSKLHADEIVDLGGASLASEVGAVSADHLLQTSDQGIDALVKGNVVATVLPVTAFSLRESYARARDMIDSGAAVALATDFNPGSCFSHSIPLVAALAAIQLKLTPAEIINGLTINAAAAVGRADRIGSLACGKQADVIMLEYPSHLFLMYHVGMNIVDTVIKKGQVVLDKHK